MRLAVVTAIWGRPRIASIMLDSLAMQRKRLAGKLDLEIVAAGSERAQSKRLARNHGARYVETSNKPLGAKWQRALSVARVLEPDAVMLLGSDDVCNDDLLRLWAERIALGDEYVALVDVHQWNPTYGTLVYWPGYAGARAGEPIGATRCFARSLLDRLGWRLWDESLNRGLDWSTTQRLDDVPHRSCLLSQSARPIKYLGIKVTGGTLSPSLHRHRTVKQLDPQLLIDWFGDVGARALGLARTRVISPPGCQS